MIQIATWNNPSNNIAGEDVTNHGYDANMIADTKAIDNIICTTSNKTFHAMFVAPIIASTALFKIPLLPEVVFKFTSCEAPST
jgi:hypothetical protein